MAVSGILKNENGFSLVELSIVMVVSGLVMAAAFSIYKSYFDSESLHETYYKEIVINDAIMTFYGMARRYPCPADGSLSAADPMYGIENCNDGPAPVPVVLGSCNASGGYCNAGGRDTGLDGTPGPDSVLIGVLPFRTIMKTISAGGASSNLSFSSSIDRWGRFFSYAVTKIMTSNSTFNAAAGAISIIKEDNASLLAKPGMAHYAVISHGKNGAGGFVAETGVISSPCDAGSPLERKNCDNDATFMAALLSLGDGASYNDDIVFFQSWVASSLWDIAANGIDIFNKNPGNVGIGTATPTEKLEVAGSLALSGNYNARSMQICDDAGGYCFPSSLLGGTPGLDCKNVASPTGTYRLLTGIVNGAPVCSDPIPFPAIAASQPPCGSGQFVSGVNMDGTFICSSF